MQFSFPKNFLFGAASSACQIESGCTEGGKGEDVCEHFYKIHPEKYQGGDPEQSADFYHRYPQDIQMMKELGLRAFRFSVSWSRIFPKGPESLCQAGLDYYRDVVQRLKEANIKAFFDLWHCDLPYWVIEKGGVLNPEFVEWFRIYARAVFSCLGDQVDYWSTINEPSINIMYSYARGANAPFHNDMGEAVRACHNGLLAHFAAVKEYKALGCKGQIGMVVHAEPTYAWSLEEKDVEAAKRKQAFYSGWWLDPILKGHYPEVLKDWDYVMGKLPAGYQKDLDEAFLPADFVAVNYYAPAFARYRENEELCYESMQNPNLPKDDYGFYSYPQGLFDLTLYLAETYPGKDIFITENGIGREKWGNPEEEREDDYRIHYMKEHLRSLSRAIRAGAPVKGYFHWTIMDTNELYAGGYHHMFGLTQVNYDTKERIPRKSWYYYQKVIREGKVD